MRGERAEARRGVGIQHSTFFYELEHMLEFWKIYF